MTRPDRDVPSGPARARAAARREVVRRHHPDVGGDPEVLQRELEAVDEAHAAAVAGPPVELRGPGRWQPVARRAGRVGRSVRRGGRRLRSRLPRGWPGARRFTDI